MEQSKSPDTGKDPRVGGNSELVSKIANHQAVTLVIQQDRLPSYLEAALSTGFKVEKIADEGEEFPYISIKMYRESIQVEYDAETRQPKVSNIKVQGKGYVAVSIERPEDSKNHTPFWDKLKSLEQKKV